MDDAEKKNGAKKNPAIRSRKRGQAPKSTVIYVKISNRDEQIELLENTTDDEVIELFEAAAELTTGNVLHLISSADTDPQRLMVDRNIPPNTPETRYTLVIGLASLRSQMAVSKLGSSSSLLLFIACVNRLDCSLHACASVSLKS
jgi:hypothetical protein